VARKKAAEPTTGAASGSEAPAAAGSAPAPAPESAPGDDAAGPEPAGAVEESPPAPTASRGGRRYRHRELKLADGGRLVLRTDGTIARFDDAGTRTDSWTTGDPDWPGHAIRFGLYPEPTTVAPNSSGVRGTRPPI
jgi:hypothetical protein